MTLTPEQEKRFRFQAQLEQETDYDALDAQIDAANGDDGPFYTGAHDPSAATSAEQEWWDSQNPLQKAYYGAANVAGGINKGAVFDIMDMPANLYNLGQMGLQKAGVVDEGAQQAMPMSEMWPFKDLKEWSTARAVPKGVSRAADATRTGSEWFGGAVLPAGYALQTGKWGAAGTQSIDDALAIALRISGAPSSKTPAVLSPKALGDVRAAMRPEVYATAGATIGAATEIPHMDTVGGLVGGLKGGPKTKKLSSTEKKAVKAITRNLRQSTGQGVENLRKNLERGEKGSLADLMESPNMYGVEREVARVSDSDYYIKRLNELADERVAGAVEDTKNILPTDQSGAFTQGVQDEARRRAGKITAVGNEKAAAAAAKADEAAAEAAKLQSAALRDEAITGMKVAELENLNTVPPKVQNAPRVSEASSKLAQSTQKVADVRFDKARKIMDTYKKTAPVDLKKDTSDMLDKFYARNADSVNDLADMKKLYADELRKIERWKTEPATPADIINTIKKLKDKTWKARDSADYAHNYARELTLDLEAMLEKAPNAGKYRKANKLYAEAYSEIVPPNVQQALKDGNTDLFAEKLTLSGTPGADTARWAKETGSKTIANNMQKTLRSLAKREGITPGFMSKYDEALSEFPDLKKELQAKVDADVKVKNDITRVKSDSKFKQAEIKEGLAQAKQRQTLAGREETLAVNRANKAKKAADTSVVGQYAKEPKKVLKKQLTDTNVESSIGNLKSLKRQAMKDGTEASFRSQINDEIADIVFTKADGLDKATNKTISKFEDVKNRLLKAEVIDEKEAEALTAGFKRIRQYQARGKDITPAQIKETLTAMDKIWASALSVTGLQVVPGSSHQLMLANRIKDTANELILQSKNKPETLLKIEEFILNPEKFLDAVDRTKDLDIAFSNWVTRAGRKTGRGAKGLTKATARFRQPYSEETE